MNLPRKKTSQINNLMYNPGDKVTFFRNQRQFTGIVINVRDKSVLVEVTPADAEFLQLKNYYTIVNHKKYEVI
ncbi:DUF2187 family protein [Cytobacillus purgationiresistens]|uniref:Uncharacterized protein YkvS n=1 Tax=Cytobacillus purgationiresistens TaxID=863449 RepID=A0ABU0ARD7_9BACI|nr:DUF2187 family protein [Cytobacillus purgationiresistens]MDQ0273352.1 uncharacterized protein YkvS [Cytobacillus purgationiresistens]